MERQHDAANARARRPLVAVTADLRRHDGLDWHAAPAPYIAAAARVAGAWPVIVPALGPDAEAAEILSRVDGVLATGSRSNVHPSSYGGAETPGHAPFDPARDATALPLIAGALARGLPLLAICRGMQELNVALGGTLAAEIETLPGTDDHRAPDGEDQDARFAPRHAVSLRPEGRLAAILGAGPVTVSSLHRQGLARLAAGLDVEAEAEDGVIEAVSARDAPGFAIGVQWHPEYFAETDPPSRRLFEAFGAALRAGRQASVAAE